MTNRNRVFARALTAAGVVVLSLAWGGRARADLLDDEDTSAPKKATATGADKDDGEPKSAASPANAAAGAKKSGKSEKMPSEKAKPTGGEEASGSTPTRPSHTKSDTTVVVPPKQPGKPLAKKGKGKPEEPVHFDSKGLKGLRDKGLVELTKDVVVTHGDMRMEADRAEIYFDEGQKDKKDKGLKKVVADGTPVKIYGVDENSGDKFHGFGNQATYLAKDRTVILEGNARLWRGDDSVIRSKKITYEMDSGWIRADTVAGEVVPEKTTGGGEAGTPPPGKGASKLSIDEPDLDKPTTKADADPAASTLAVPAPAKAAKATESAP